MNSAYWNIKHEFIKYFFKTVNYPFFSDGTVSLYECICTRCEGQHRKWNETLGLTEEIRGGEAYKLYPTDCGIVGNKIDVDSFLRTLILYNLFF